MRWGRRRARTESRGAVRTAGFDALHTAILAAPSLRAGLTHEGAERSVRHLRALLGCDAVALIDRSTVLAWDGREHDHADTAVTLAAVTLADGGTAVLTGDPLACADAYCPLRTAVVAAVVDGDAVVGALLAFGPQTSAPLIRAVEEVAKWVSAQVELAGADRRRTTLMEAELRALRAQISPHFVYNCLTAIASFVRTDPDRARDLLLEFADFTRYSLQRDNEFTTLADELHNTERYLALEQARFGDRLGLSLRVAPEVLPVSVPYLVVQPLVENAVRHGLGARQGRGTVSIEALDGGPHALISIEDDGDGCEPQVVRRALSPDSDSPSVGLTNVDRRLRHLYGDRYGLVVETAPDAGFRVSFRVPKFAARDRHG